MEPFTFALPPSVVDLARDTSGPWRTFDMTTTAHYPRPGDPPPAHNMTRAYHSTGRERALVLKLWPVFLDAAARYGVEVETVEIDGVTRYIGPDGNGPLHRDDEQVDATGRVLSMTVALDGGDAYEGGAFLLDTPRGRFAFRPERAGEGVIFPASWLHEVRPVRRGVRRALVARALAPGGTSAALRLWRVADGTATVRHPVGRERGALRRAVAAQRARAQAMRPSRTFAE